ncbi:MAG: tRNA uridine-5-carboxymethylaminomethyl(34) synthesis GTPase MnmE [Vicinamibacterales bacterium]
MAFSTDDTIVAIATPDGRGGLGVVRVSGTDAVRLVSGSLDRTAPLEPRHATFAHLMDRVTAVPRAIDEVVVTWFAAPASYTGEDVVEIAGHGSPVLLRQIVAGLIRAGARLAEPGEFTLRAYLNGRLDLVQAEAVADLVDAVTPAQSRAAMDQLQGTLTADIGRAGAALFDLAARLEASLDFPDEGFHFITREDAVAAVEDVRRAIARLVESGRRGRLIREGRLVVIAGPPNAGKSSLFNALLGASRSIVTDVPGTTRDVITERIDLDGLPVTLVDTAGLRHAEDAIEAEGVARARQARDVAALTVLVLDGSAPPGRLEREALDDVRAPRVIVASKLDHGVGWQPEALGLPPAGVVRTSTQTGEGLEALRATLRTAMGLGEDLEETPAVTNLRHLTLLEEAHAALDRAVEALEAGATEEIVLVELSVAREALESITGRRTADDLLRHIFTRFCVGK